ncbi:MAG TPA: hypothetical protein PLB99_14205 [Thermotogota bacterium]|nr:hypothetical protein [Thermotogota bacterium]
MNILYSKTYNNFAGKLKTFIQGLMPNESINQQNLPIDSSFKPDGNKMILIADGTDTRLFINSLNTMKNMNNVILVDVWDEEAIKDTSPTLDIKNNALTRKSVVCNIPLTKSAPTITPAVVNTGNVIKTIFSNYDAKNTSGTQVYYTGSSIGSFEDDWYKNIFLSYFPDMVSLFGMIDSLTLLNKISEEANNPVKGIPINEVPKINLLLEEITEANAVKSYGKINNIMIKIGLDFKKAKLMKLFSFLGAAAVPVDFMNIICEYFSRLCAITDVVSSGQFLSKRGKKSSKQFRKSYVISRKQYRMMKKNYSKVYKVKKKAIGRDHLQMQNAMLRCVHEYNLILLMLSELVDLQLKLIRNLEVLSPLLIALDATFNAKGKLIDNLAVNRTEYEKKFKSDPVNTPLFKAVCLQLQGSIQSVQPNLQKINLFVEWFEKIEITLGKIKSDLEITQTNVNREQERIEEMSTIASIVNNMIVTTGLMNIAALNPIPFKEIKKATKKFTLVWINLMRVLMSSISKDNKTKVKNGFMQAWDFIVDLVDKESENLRKERRRRILIFSSITLVVAILAIGIDWPSFIDSFKVFENGWELKNFQNFGSSLWNSIKKIPDNFIGIYNNIFHA